MRNPGSAIDTALLAKLLSMTDSQHDAEALAAIRKANQLLRSQAVTWSDVLEQRAPGELPSEQQRAEQHRDTFHREEQEGTWSDGLDQYASDELPLGHQRAEQYRDAFRREAIALRLLAFPFWIFVELLAAVAPEKPLDTHGRPLTFVFAFCMVLSVVTWIAVGCTLAFEFD
jgi:hypothetical protein